MVKVSATYRDGFRSAGTLTIIGRNAVAKARRVGELVLAGVREAGFELRDSIIECVGAGDLTAAILEQSCDATKVIETELRIAVESDSRDAVECFTRELTPYITAGPQGTTGYAEGRPRVHSVFRYWPCLIAREAVAPQVEILSSSNAASRDFTQANRKFFPASNLSSTTPTRGFCSMKIKSPSHLFDIACARSGDKGSSANVGVIARSEACWHFLRSWLTTELVAEYLSPLGVESVDRFELPNLHSLNFILHGVLRQTLRTDAQGKALGQILLEMPLPVDAPDRIAANERNKG
jgi:hypothetical protein